MIQNKCMKFHNNKILDPDSLYRGFNQASKPKSKYCINNLSASQLHKKIKPMKTFFKCGKLKVFSQKKLDGEMFDPKERMFFTPSVC